ncbi:putative leader peptide [Streptomyces sp. YGL11-2]
MTPRERLLLTLREAPCFTPRVTDHSSRFWRRVHLDLVRYAGCMCRPSC